MSAGTPNHPNQFQKWYLKNKEKLAQKRRHRYFTDSAYRQRVKDAVKKSRGKSEKRSPLPEGYAYTLQEAAAVLDVAPSTMREWLRKKYLPKPRKYLNRFVFTAEQVELMDKLREFLATKANKQTVHSQEFTDLKAFILVNWS